MTTITGAVGGGNWSVGGSWVGGIAPTAADDVLLTAASGNITIDGSFGTPNHCRSLNCTGYVGTLSHPSNTVLAIGNASGGSMTLVAGMTYTPVFSSVLQFISTTTGNTITCGGKTLGSAQFGSGTGGGWSFSDSYADNGGISHTDGTLNTNGQTVNTNQYNDSGATLTRALLLGASVITVTGTSAWIMGSTGLTFTCGTSSIICTAAACSFQGGGHTFNNVSFTGGAGNCSLTDSNTFANLTRDSSSTANKTCGWLITSANQTVTGNFTIKGNSDSNRLIVSGNQNPGISASSTITVAGSIIAQYVDISDIIGAGAASWNLSAITGGSGDCGGNSGITFTTGANQFWFKDTGSFSTTANWFLATNGGGGAGRVPLPQDTAIFDANSFSAASKTVTCDMPRTGGINFTGSTNTPTFTNNTNTNFFGSITLISAMTLSTGSSKTIAGRTSLTLTSAGKTFGSSFTFSQVTGDTTLQDNFLSTSSLAINSSFNANNFNIQATTIFSAVGTTRTVTMGSGTWTATSTGGVWNFNSGGLTLNKGTSTIIINNVTATAKTFTGGGNTYNNITFSGDNITVTGANTFNIMAINNAGLTNGLKLTAAVTQTCSAITTNGFAANLAKLLSATAATHTINCSGLVDLDFMSITNSIGANHVPFYAGANSTNGGGNTNWVFTVRPVGGLRRNSSLNGLSPSGITQFNPSLEGM